DRRTLLLEHHLLVPRRQVRLAARRKRLPVQDVLVGARLCHHGRSRRKSEDADPFADADVHATDLLASFCASRTQTALVTSSVRALPPRSLVCSFGSAVILSMA